MKQLTQMQKKFISEYIRTLDGIEALKFAGYKSENYETLLAKMLSQDCVVCGIKEQINRQVETLNIQKGYVIQKLLQIAKFSLEEEDILDKEGLPTGKKKLRDSSAGLKALESLCKYLGFSSSGKPKDESVTEAKIITISNLDDDKI